jgi:iron complex transport system substrate-binding protein
MALRLCWILVCISLLAMAGGARNVAVIDYTDHSISVDAPVKSIVSLASGASEIVCALDGGRRLVGRGSSSNFPPYLEKVAVVGDNSYSPDLELIVKLHPDLVIADTMLSEQNRRKLEDSGIPVMVERFIDPARTIAVMENLGSMMGKEGRASELCGFIKGYQDLIEARTASLRPGDMPGVFFEWLGRPYHTVSSGGSYDSFISFAGGVNVAGSLSNKSSSYPDVTPEWVMKVDPDVIIQTQPNDKAYTKEDLMGLRSAIMARPELQNVTAVKSGRVYVMSGKVTSGVRSIVGELYLARWFNPRLFEDIDPEGIHQELIQKFYGQSLEGAYAYPSNLLKY